MSSFSARASGEPYAYTVCEPQLRQPQSYVFDPGNIIFGHDSTRTGRKPALLVHVGAANHPAQVVELKINGQIKSIVGAGANGPARNLNYISDIGYFTFENGDLLVAAEGGIYRVNRLTGETNANSLIPRPVSGTPGDGWEQASVDPTTKNSFYFAAHHGTAIYKATIKADGTIDTKTVVGGGNGEPTVVEQPATNIRLNPRSFSFSIDRKGRVLIVDKGDRSWIAELNRDGKIKLIRGFSNYWIPQSAIRLGDESIATTKWSHLGIGIERITPDGNSSWLVSPHSHDRRSGIPVSLLQLNAPTRYDRLSASPDGGLLVNDIINYELSTRYIQPFQPHTPQQELITHTPHQAAAQLINTRLTMAMFTTDSWTQNSNVAQLPRDVRKIIAEYALSDYATQYWQTMTTRWMN